MQAKNKINKYFGFFLLGHIIIWTLIPTLSNNNLPLDTIEHLAWSTDLQFGYGKHPPVVSWMLNFFYLVFGSQDWAYYFLSQLFIVFSFLIVFIFSKEVLKNDTHSLISVLLLEGIYFYNFTTPEFNVNICQLPFWSLSILYLWKGFKNNKNIDWLLFGLFAGLGVLSKYLFIYLLISIDIFFIYLIIKKKFNYKCLLSLLTFLLVLAPHLIWLVINDYTTITYALNRTGTGNQVFIDHLIHPLIFLGKQIGILIPFFIMFLFIIKKIKTKINLKDNKLIFLLTINIVPIVLILLTSLVLGIKIRTMWMTPFYLFSGVLIVYTFQKKINLSKLKNFTSVFLFLFVLSPFVYFYISITQTDKRTDYPGKEIARIVQKKWDRKYQSKIIAVSGNEWHAGNLSYHLELNPKWINSKNIEKNNIKQYKNQLCSFEFEDFNSRQWSVFCLYGE